MHAPLKLQAALFKRQGQENFDCFAVCVSEEVNARCMGALVSCKHNLMQQKGPGSSGKVLVISFETNETPCDLSMTMYQPLHCQDSQKKKAFWYSLTHKRLKFSLFFCYENKK